MKKVIIILAILLTLILLVGCEDKNVYNSFCHRLGYNTSTGHEDISGSIFRDNADMRIECDNRIMPYSCNIPLECINQDKYGKCLGYGDGLWCMPITRNPTEIIWIQASDKQ